MTTFQKNSIGCQFIFFVMLILMGACTSREAVSETPGIEEMTLVHSGIIAKVHCESRLNPAHLLLTRNYYWTLLFEEGPVIMIKESPFWFAPIGKKVSVYEYRNRLTGKREYCVERASEQRKGCVD